MDNNNYDDYNDDDNDMKRDFYIRMNSTER